MKKNIRILVLLTGIAIIILIGLYFVGQREPIAEESLPVETYPDYLIEGTVMSMDIDKKIIKLKTNTSLIKEATLDLMEKNVSFNENTECMSYLKAADETKKIECLGIKENDNLVIVTIESTREKINKLEEFTAVKITKMLPRIIE